jgi:hypothetical protein
MVDIETPDSKKNGAGGTLIHSKIKILPLGPAGPFVGPFVLQGTLIAMQADGPTPVGHMEFQADTLPLLDFGLTEFRKAFASAMKSLVEEAQAAKLLRPDAGTVRRINETKGS